MVSGLLYGQSNILLISLHDKDTIDHRHPVFNWYYSPGPQGRDDIRYVFILTELKKGQSAESGITVNRALFRINGVQGFQLVYPYDAPELEYGKRYGWQLQKTVNGVITDKSEAWEFILYKPVKEPYKYVTLSSAPDATMYEAVNGKLFFVFKERYNLSDAKFYVYDSENKRTSAKLSNDLSDKRQQGDNSSFDLVRTGRNFFELDVRGASAGKYKLLVVNAKGDKYQLNFFVK